MIEHPDITMTEIWGPEWPREDIPVDEDREYEERREQELFGAL